MNACYFHHRLESLDKITFYSYFLLQMQEVIVILERYLTRKIKISPFSFLLTKSSSYIEISNIRYVQY